MKRAQVIGVDEATRKISAQVLGGPTITALCTGALPAADAVVLVDEVGPGSWVCLGTLGADDWGRQWGELLYVETTATTASAVTFDVMSGSIVVTPGRRVEFNAHCPILKTTATGDLYLEMLTSAGTVIGSHDETGIPAGITHTFNAGPKVITTDASTATAWKVRITIPFANGAQLACAATRPGTFLVKDIGPA